MKVFETNKTALSIYLPAGYPTLDSALEIVTELEKRGVDFLELGMPFSDPLADGPTVQYCSEIAIENGMNLDTYFEQAAILSKTTSIPIIFMGYYNQLLKFGLEKFAEKAKVSGIQKLIVPDMPIEEYMAYKSIFDKEDVQMIFLITPNTADERIRKIDQASNGFLYCVADNSITGAKKDMSNAQIAYFDRVRQLGLSNPLVAGFGISSKEQIEKIAQHVDGVIVGSAFLKEIIHGSVQKGLDFVNTLK